MPIFEEKGIFRLDTADTSYWFDVSAFGHPRHIYYSARLSSGDPESLRVKRVMPYGSAVIYDEADPSYCLDTLCLEWSGVGKGDFRESPCEVKMPDGSFDPGV